MKSCLYFLCFLIPWTLLLFSENSNDESLTKSHESQIHYCSRQTYVPCAVIFAKHVALIKCLTTLFGIERRLVQQHATLLPRGHFVAEGTLTSQSQHRDGGLLEL